VYIYTTTRYMEQFVG